MQRNMLCISKKKGVWGGGELLVRPGTALEQEQFLSLIMLPDSVAVAVAAAVCSLLIADAEQSLFNGHSAAVSF